MMQRTIGKFKAAGSIRRAKMLKEQPHFIERKHQRGARANGIRYEAKVIEKLQQRLYARPDLQLFPQTWIEFEDDTGRRWCQIDAFILNAAKGIGVVYEVKYRHVATAWFQLWQLYVPVLEHLFPGIHWGTCEICKWFDPDTEFPGPLDMTPDPFSVPHLERTAVHIWNPARD